MSICLTKYFTAIASFHHCLLNYKQYSVEALKKFQVCVTLFLYFVLGITTILVKLKSHPLRSLNRIPRG